MPRKATVGEICGVIEELAPLHWAESWDNVGLQVGDPSRWAGRILVALELTDLVLTQALESRIDLIVVHHPPIFRPLKALRFDGRPGRRLELMIQAGIGLYAAHTNLDQAAGGTNETLATLAGLVEPEVLAPAGEGLTPDRPRGHGRVGRLAEPTLLGELAARLKRELALPGLRRVGDPERAIRTAAVGAGAGSDLIGRASQCGADVLITGDVGYHDARDALDQGLAIIDIGHFGSEQAVVHPLAAHLRAALSGRGLESEVLEERLERDPFAFL